MTSKQRRRIRRATMLAMDPTASRVFIVLTCLCLGSGCGSGSSPSAPSDPGRSVRAELISQTVFLGDCLANLTACTGEVTPVMVDNRYARYNLPVSAVGTIRWCVSHPRVPNRVLRITSPNGVSTDYPEDTTPTPVCVGMVRSNVCLGSGITVTEDLLVEDEDARDARDDRGEIPLTQFQTSPIHLAATAAQAGCPF